MKKALFFFWGVTLTAGLPLVAQNNRTAGPEAYSVVFLDKNVQADSIPPALGEAVVGRTVLPVRLSDQALLRLARIEAVRMGGNAIQILPDREPGRKNARKGMRVAVFHLDDPSPFEREIVWTATRKLNWSDFKGSPPAAAAADSVQFRLEMGAVSACGLEVIPTGVTAGGRLEVDVLAKFVCLRSWVRDAVRDEYTLLHEQGHFDIAELFARKIRKELQTKSFRSATYATDGIAYLEEMNRAMNRYQEQYDRETGSGIYQKAQAEWNRRIERELEELQAFAY